MARGTQRGLARLAALVVMAGGAAACSSDRTLAEPVPEQPSPSWADAHDVRDRCLSSTPDGDLAAVTLSAPGMTLPGVLVEPADAPRVGVVMLPQIGAAGLCGGLPYAGHLAEQGVAVLSIDPCGYGDSECDAELRARPEAYVTVATQWLREETDVQEVVLVGASMGGSQAVRAVAAGAPTDRWADLSGPSAWDGTWLRDLAPRIDQPGLVARARTDGAPAELRAARRLAADTDAAFVSPEAGHGWDMLLRMDGRPTDLGRRLLLFIESGPPPGDRP